MKIVDIKNKDSLQNAAQVLKEDGILIFPTDTVYGIGCILNKTAIRKLYKIKNRPATQPTAVLMTKKRDTPPKNFTEISPELIKLADITIQTSETLSGISSTIYDIEHYKIIRE